MAAVSGVYDVDDHSEPVVPKETKKIKSSSAQDISASTSKSVDPKETKKIQSSFAQDNIMQLPNLLSPKKRKRFNLYPLRTTVSQHRSLF